MAGSSLTLVTNIADFCRYTPTPPRRADRPVRLRGLGPVVVDTFVGGYAAAATGETNPFVAVADLTGSRPLLAVLLVAIVVQGIAANIVNVYTAGLSLVNTLPVLGRLRATALVAAAAIGALRAARRDRQRPELDRPSRQRRRAARGRHARRLPGRQAAPDRRLGALRPERAIPLPERRQRRRRSPPSRAGSPLYYALPHAWLKIAWGIGVGAVAYLVLCRLEAATVRFYAPAGAAGSSARSGP